MLTHKNLLLAAKKIITSFETSIVITGESLKELREAAEKSESFLQSSKSFEYEGAITVPHGSVIKLKDISMDLDDVFKMLSNKKSDIKGKGGIYIVWEDEKIEVKPNEPTTEQKAIEPPVDLMSGCE
jgi:hypothetical protein